MRRKAYHLGDADTFSLLDPARQWALSLVAETLAAFCIEVGFELDTRSEYTITRLLERVRAGELNENYDLMLKEVPGASMRPGCLPRPAAGC